MKHLMLAVGLLMLAGMAKAQCSAFVNPSPGVLVDSGPVHNMAFESSNQVVFYTTPATSPTLHFPGAKWIRFGADVDAGYVNLGPNWTTNGACPRTWTFTPISWMQLDKGYTVIWKQGPFGGGNLSCSDQDSDDSSCYFSIFNANSARSPQIAVSPGEVLYAYDCMEVGVSGSGFSTSTSVRCGVIKLVVE